MRESKTFPNKAFTLFQISYQKNDGMLEDENFNELMEETLEKGKRVSIDKRVKMGQYLSENYREEVIDYFDYLCKTERESMEEDMAMEAYYNEKYGR